MNTQLKPSPEAVRRCGDEFEKDLENNEHYVAQGRSLERLFRETHPKNVDIDEILVKVATLNTFYSTRIRKPYAVAKHILDLDIDERLKVGDVDLVNEVAMVWVGEKYINFYSFAAKYCAHHNFDIYPIYDRYVGKMLQYLNERDTFYPAKVTNSRLRDYPTYCEIQASFRQCYGLEDVNIRDIDTYLWKIGKEKYSPY